MRGQLLAEEVGTYPVVEVHSVQEAEAGTCLEPLVLEAAVKTFPGLHLLAAEEPEAAQTVWRQKNQVWSEKGLTILLRQTGASFKFTHPGAPPGGGGANCPGGGGLL